MGCDYFVFRILMFVFLIVYMASNPVIARLHNGKLSGLCRRHHIRRLSLFGSVLTGRFRKGSDVDVLVEFEPHKTPGLLGMAKIAEDLSVMVGRPVDLRTPNELSRYFRDEVIANSRIAYAR
jgi:predicted nucleotidyltransferase